LDTHTEGGDNANSETTNTENADHKTPAQNDPTAQHNTDQDRIDELKKNIQDKTTETPKDEFFDIHKFRGVEYTEASWATSEYNIYKISLSDLSSVDKLNKINLEHLFEIKERSGVELRQFESVIKHSHAETMFSLKREGVDDNWHGIWDYVHKLNELTGVKYIAETPTHKAETIEDYIYRALMKAAKLGKLDEVKL
ncbi:MAG: hypothetical protein M3P22_01810, partial [bacterium]|nr:hypothetical protein [bacterium]